MQASEGAIKSQEAQAAAKAAGDRADYFDKMTAGTPATPGRPAIPAVEGELLPPDEPGMPYQRVGGNPGSPAIEPTEAIPGHEYSPVEAMQVKSRTGYGTPKNEMTPLEQRVQNAQYMGAKDAAEDAVGKTLGPEAKQAIVDANAKRGSIIESGTGQATAAENYQKLVRGLMSLRGTDAAFAGAGSGGGAMIGHPVLGAIAALMAKKGFDAARIAQMPAGYLMDKLASSPAASQAVISAATSPWLNMNKDKQPVAGVGK
jgi:hypothetical protein